MKILFMGLPGAGKTYLAERVSEELGLAWYNADAVRTMAKDWDFSNEGRVRQSQRMRTFADFEKSNNRAVICDFVCPTQQTRDEFGADLTVWVNTITEGRYKDTNSIFEQPKEFDFCVEFRYNDSQVKELCENIQARINL